MSDVLRTQYEAVDEWLRGLSRAVYALVMGAVWFAVWTGLEVALDGRSLLTAALVGGVGALVFGGLRYSWGSDRE